MYSNHENIVIDHYNIAATTPITTATEIDPRPIFLLAALSSTDCAETDSSEDDEEEDCDEEESPPLALESDEEGAGDEPLSLDGEDESDDGDGRDGDSESGLLLLEGLAEGAGESVLLGAAEELGVSDDSPAPSPIGPL